MQNLSGLKGQGLKFLEKSNKGLTKVAGSNGEKLHTKGINTVSSAVPVLLPLLHDPTIPNHPSLIWAHPQRCPSNRSPAL